MSNQMLTAALRAPCDPSDRLAVMQLTRRASQAADEIDRLRYVLSECAAATFIIKSDPMVLGLIQGAAFQQELQRRMKLARAALETND